MLFFIIVYNFSSVFLPHFSSAQDLCGVKLRSSEVLIEILHIVLFVVFDVITYLKHLLLSHLWLLLLFLFLFRLFNYILLRSVRG
jgi:hypothetical protein